MSDGDVKALLDFAEAFLPIACEMSEPVYGVFHGGDPRNFTPDPDSSTEAEQQHHKEDCDKWAAAEQAGPEKSDCESLFDDDGKLRAVITRSQYGLGVNCDSKLQEIAHYAAMALKRCQRKSHE